MKRIAGLILAALLAASLLAACQRSDGPPKDEGSPPPAHNGSFVSDYGELRFSGDGKSIELDLGPELAEAIGLPEGGCSGTYAFLIDYPKGLYRYDKASILRLRIGDGDHELRMPVGATTEEQIAVYADGLNGGEAIYFVRRK